MLKTDYLKGYYLLPSGKLGKIESSAKHDDGSEHIFIKELGEMFDIKDIEISECIIDLLSIGDIVDGKLVSAFSNSLVDGHKVVAFLEDNSKKEPIYEIYNEEDLEKAYIITAKGLSQIEYIGG